MKRLIFLSLVLVGCSDSEESAPQGFTCSTMAGHYESYLDPSDTLDIFNDCTFTDSYCGYDAEYTLPNSLGQNLITVIDTNGAPGCMSSTAHACELEYNGIELAIECDNGVHSYYFLRR